MESKIHELPRVTIALVGVGNFPVLAPTLASLAMYHGERPLELRLWDTSEDRLNAAYQLARRLCLAAGNLHKLEAVLELPMALHAVHRVIWMLDRSTGTGITENDDELDAQSYARFAPDTAKCLAVGTQLLNLPGESVDWPVIPTGKELAYYPHQVLRWIKEDDEPRLLLWQHERSPITVWLNEF